MPKTPLLLNFAGNVERINGTWPAFEAALKAGDTPCEACFSEGMQPGSRNTSMQRCNEVTEKPAWTARRASRLYPLS